MTQFLTHLHTLVWSLWDHQNAVLHRLEQPRVKQTETLLDTLIIQELEIGSADLPPTDHHFFNQTLGDILFQSLSYQQAWYSNIMSARLRQDRHSGLNPIRTLTHPNQHILDWIQTGYFW